MSSTSLGEIGMTSGSLISQLDRVLQHVEQISLRLSKVENLLDGQSTGVLLAGVVESVSQARGALANDLNAAENNLSAHISSVAGQFQSISVAHTDLSLALGRVANEVNAIHNLIAHLTQTQQTLLVRLDKFEQAAASDRERDNAQALLAARSVSALLKQRSQTDETYQQVVVPPLPARSLTDQLARLEKMAPMNFAAWQSLYEAGIAEGRRSPVGNLSHEGHQGADYFRMFINIHAKGALLDVGCGPLEMPNYLADYPLQLLAGMDPQLPFSPHPFPFAQAFAEEIPWPDQSFATVVIATSLDHVFLLDVALAQIKRVLTPRGRLLIWTGMLQQSPSYDPIGEKITPPDPFHLFHPGRNWFYDLFREDYRVIEIMPTVAGAEFVALERV